MRAHLPEVTHENATHEHLRIHIAGLGLNIRINHKGLNIRINHKGLNIRINHKGLIGINMTGGMATDDEKKISPIPQQEKKERWQSPGTF
jgi:hypothetical protein